MRTDFTDKWEFTSPARFRDDRGANMCLARQGNLGTKRAKPTPNSETIRERGGFASRCLSGLARRVRFEKQEQKLRHEFQETVNRRSRRSRRRAGT